MTYATTLAGYDVVAYWPMDEPSGTTAVDAVGSLDGVVTGATPGATGVLPAEASTAYSFDGGDSIAIDDVETLVAGGPASQIAWFYHPSSGGSVSHGHICGWWTGGSITFFALKLDSQNNILCRFINSGSTQYDLTVPFTNDAIHMISMSFNGTTFAAYLDGDLVDDISASGSLPSANFLYGIGARPNPDLFFKGRIGHVSVHDAWIDAAGHAAIYAAGAGGGGGGPSGSLRVMVGGSVVDVTGYKAMVGGSVVDVTVG